MNSKKQAPEEKDIAEEMKENARRQSADMERWRKEKEEKSKQIYVKNKNCCKCGKQAVAFFPACDPDIPQYPYCRECLDKVKLDLGRKLLAINEKSKEDNYPEGFEGKPPSLDDIKRARGYLQCDCNHSKPDKEGAEAKPKTFFEEWDKAIKEMPPASGADTPTPPIPETRIEMALPLTQENVRKVVEYAEKMDAPQPSNSVLTEDGKHKHKVEVYLRSYHNGLRDDCEDCQKQKDGELCEWHYGIYQSERASRYEYELDVVLEKKNAEIDALKKELEYWKREYRTLRWEDEHDLNTERLVKKDTRIRELEDARDRYRDLELDANKTVIKRNERIKELEQELKEQQEQSILISRDVKENYERQIKGWKELAKRREKEIDALKITNNTLRKVNKDMENIIRELEQERERIRPEILEFAKEMERIMAKHDNGKGDSWKQMPIKQLDDKFNEEIEEASIEGDRQEWVDVANVCMMIWKRRQENAELKKRETK